MYFHFTCSHRVWPSRTSTVGLDTHIVIFLCFKLAFLGTHRLHQNVFCIGSHGLPVSTPSRKRKNVLECLRRLYGDAWKGRVSVPYSLLCRKATTRSGLPASAAGKYIIVGAPGVKEISCLCSVSKELLMMQTQSPSIFTDTIINTVCLKLS